MAAIRTWSISAASNNQATPDGWPEGQAPSTVNDVGREMMAAVRTWYQDAEWIDWGHVPTSVSDTQFSVPTDQTAVYTVNRRVRVVGATTGYGTISASSYGAPNTTVTVTWDSGTTPTSPTTASVGIITPTNKAISASSVAVLDSGANFTATNVEDVLAEIEDREQRKWKTADESVTSSTTLQDDDHLAGFALTAGAYYSIDGYIKYSAEAAASIKAAFTFTNAPQNYGATTLSNNASVTFHSDADTSAEFMTLAGGGAAILGAIVKGLILANAVTGGTVTMQWAQGNSDVIASTFYKGSWIAIRKIS